MKLFPAGWRPILYTPDGVSFMQLQKNSGAFCDKLP